MSKTSNNSNPFVRGYLNLRVVQTQAPAYTIYGDDVDGRSVHIGDADSEQAAQTVAQRLGFNTGIYSRCWEISSAHLRESSSDYLMELADIATPERFLFILNCRVDTTFIISWLNLVLGLVQCTHSHLECIRHEIPRHLPYRQQPFSADAAAKSRPR